MKKRVSDDQQHGAVSWLPGDDKNCSEAGVYLPCVGARGFCVQGELCLLQPGEPAQKGGIKRFKNGALRPHTVSLIVV